MKFCRDCVHFVPDLTQDEYLRGALAKCGRSAVVPDLVTGEQRRRFCETERGLPDGCGIEARFFEADNCDVIP